MIEVDARTAGEKAVAVKAGQLPGPAKSLAEAMCRVMEQVGYARSVAAADALRPEMIKQQLVLLPVGVTPLAVEPAEGRGGRPGRTRVVYEFKVLHAPSGQSEPVVVIGEAGDGPPGSAMAAARASALVMAFHVEAGAGADAPPAPARRPPGAKPTYAAADNLPLRAKLVQAVAQKQFLATVDQWWRDEVQPRVRAAELSEVDVNVLIDAAKHRKRHLTAATR